jgi:uncharacterized protein
MSICSFAGKAEYKTYMFRYTPIPFHCVRVNDSFWSERQRVNHERSLLKQYELCKRTGRFDALRLEWTPDSSLPKPHVFWDSDTAKWLEAACYACRIRPDAALRAKIDEVAALFVSAQQPDGYLNSHFTVVRPEERWKNLRDEHELYCAGHIMEAAVAHHALTGEDSLLNTARRLADCIDRTFGREPGKLRGYCGHEEVELALVRLYRATGEKRYLKLAAYFIDERGQQPLWFLTERQPTDSNGCDYFQAHIPVREQTEAIGHAVRAAYLYIGMTDVAAETGDASLLAACERLWESVTQRKLYVTGGIGSSWFGEKFTNDFDLPSERAYCETCASVALAFWARRMLQHDGDGDYAEILERALYNGALAGMSLDGEKFFYQNPLASLGKHTRQEWFECSCCPSNLSRLLGALGENIASTSADSLLVSLYVGSEFDFELGNGAAGSVRLSGGMPWGGSVQLALSLGKSVESAWELRLRIPSWADNPRFRLNGAEAVASVERGYASLRRVWCDGDTVEVTFDVPVRQLVADPRVTSVSGHVALQRGPFVYCIEDADFAETGGALPVALSPEEAAGLVARRDDTLLDGLIVLEGNAHSSAGDAADAGLYRRATGTRPVGFRAIPYFAWDNRGVGAMRVWIPRQTG